ncbi:hypothetical protein E4U11_004868 [Claviceps purpurea]|nr:hypothetical protein E4U11_004868 [Claviceps purpurea]
MSSNWHRQSIGWSEGKKNQLAILYEMYKEEMWALIAAEIPVLWWQAEKIHWIIGKAQMEKRGSDDTFPTIRVDLPPPEVGQQREFNNPGSGWSGHEETALFSYTRSGMEWKHISRLLPGRSASSCRSYYDRQVATGPAWPQERKNAICKEYQRLKSSMWANIGEDMMVPWQAAEHMHWRLGPENIAERTGAALTYQAILAFGLSPEQHWDQEHGQF